jgi:uncharacterized protein
MPTMLPRPQFPRGRIVFAIAAVALILFFGRSICNVIIDYAWWHELGQTNTWWRIALYRNAPGFAAWLIVFLILWIAQSRGMRHAGARLREHSWYGWAVTALIALVSIVIALATTDGWTVVRYFGGHSATVSATEWTDPVFSRPLGFYFFDLPFYGMLVDFGAVCMLGGALAYYLAARGWQITKKFPGAGARAELDFNEFRSLGTLESGLFKGLMALFLVALAAYFWLGRYDMLVSDHGDLIVGLDYVQQHIGLPLQVAKSAAALLAAVLVIAGRRKLALACALMLVIDWIVPGVISSLYVRPNELTLERPFIQRHIEATRAAYGLDRRERETEFVAHAEGRIDFQRNRPLLDNVRLWDWRAFHDTLGQKQPLRPYTYADTDVDRYQINGQLRQVLLAPREMDLAGLGDAASSWINRSLIYTHGYGLVLAEANRVTSEALPVYLIKDAPVEVLTPSLKVTQPRIYFGETLHSPVFVKTSQEEFDYSSSTGDQRINYTGSGGFSLDAFGMRTVAAISEADSNIFLNNSLNSDSRMMIRRRIPERLSELAEFVTWDPDPYMVITDAGKLVWIVDGYLTSEAHPYSRLTVFDNGTRFNYIRNSIKATVDAYDGSVKMYVFDEEDPLVNAYRKLFPDLFSPASEMPADVRQHTRSPEMLFRTQAEMFRTYHMREPESFYNRADQWDLATYTTGQSGAPQTVPPTYMIMTLPGETLPEFVLTIPFTPRGKQNLIGLMIARCDGEHRGELVILDLPKQEIIPGPMQIEALIQQDQTISKDLTLWNQQGSQVLRSQMLTLPIDNTLLFVEPIFLQATNAKMPQLKKVALAVGNTLVYADTYEQALSQLEALQSGQALPARTQSAPQPATPLTTAAPSNDVRVEEVRQHLNRYRELSAQGKWAEAGKELEAIEAIVKK